MTLKPGKQTKAINILTNISRSKRNQAIKFGQLIEHKKIIEKSFTKCGGETILRPSSKNSKLSISQDQ